MSDSYPEYLNPFAEDLKPKPKLTIKNSFKGFKRSLRQSFRIKKKDDEEVTIQQKNETFRRVPVSYPTNTQTLALPRSRFHERVSRNEYHTETPGSNPFEEDVLRTTVRRKGKKRAPLPPKSMSSQHINDDRLEVPAGGSNWSLTSVETDYSGSTDNPSREEHEQETKRGSMVERFMDFNKNMDELKDDSNNNVVTKEDIVKDESNNNIPDLVISCPSETNSEKLQTNHDDDKLQTNENEEKPKELEDEDNKSTSDEDSTLVVKDITNNMIKEENSDQVSDQNHESETFLYHEKTSLYIAGSRDELIDSETYTGRVSLYITGSCDDLDANKNVTDENSNDDAAPIPKQRKNKLTKNILLGM